jgi:hypothetical protein
MRAIEIMERPGLCTYDFHCGCVDDLAAVIESEAK